MTNSANMGNGNNNDDATKLPPPSTTAMENTSSSSNNMGNRSSGDHSDNIRTAQLIQALRLGQHNLLGGGQQQDILGQQQNINASASNNPLPGTITNVGSFASSSSPAAVHPSMLPAENTAIANASLPSQEGDGSHDHEETSDSEDDDNDGEDHDEEDIMQDVVTSSNIDAGATNTTHTTSSGTAAASSQNPHETEDFKRPARAVFEKYNQCKRTLGVLMLGSNDNELSPDVFQKFPFKDIPNSYRLYVPQQGDYVAEINRRSHFLAKEAHSANDRRAIFKGISRGRHPRPKNWTVPKCREWLADPAHYIGTAEDKQFLLETIAELKRQAQMQILLGTNSSNRTVEAAAAGAETDCVFLDEKLCCAGDHHHHDHHSNTIPLTTSATISSHSTAALPEVVLESSHEPVGGEKRKAAIALEERDKNISHDHQQQHSISNTNTARKSQQQQQPHLPPPQQQQPQPQQRVMNKAAMQKDLSAVRAIVASHDDELQRQQHETAALRQELQDQKAQTAALQQQVTRMEQILDFHRLSGNNNGEGGGGEQGSGSGA